jgi:Ca-activated chloride channel homolog
MKRFKNWLFLPLIVLSFLLTAAAAPAQEPTPPPANDVLIRITQLDTSQFPKVTAYVSVTNQAGEPVAVDPATLVLMENDQQISTSQIEGVGEVGPLVTMLVIDVSGSMDTAEKLNTARSTAKAYLDQMRPNDQAGIIAFNDSVSYVQPVTADRAVLAAAIDGLQAGGDTAMYDALMKAVEELNPIVGRKAIIVLTDGLDNRSQYTPVQVIDSIGQTGLSISTVGLGEPNQGNGNLTALDETALTTLAEQAGGAYGYANDEATLQNLYDLYGRVLKSEYVITYNSPSTLRDGLNRSLTVSLTTGSSESAPNSVEASYNPGGLVPEVGGAAPWSMFFILLAILLIVLLIPTTIGVVGRLIPKKEKASSKPALPQKPRIKLK